MELTGDFVLYLIERPVLFIIASATPGILFLLLAIKGFGVRGRGFINPKLWTKPGQSTTSERLLLGFWGLIALFAAGLIIYDQIKIVFGI